MAEIDELLKNEAAWAAKFNALKALSENVTAIEQSWESKLKQLEDDNNDRHQQLSGCVDFVCSACVCVGFLLVLRFPPTISNDMDTLNYP